MSPNSFTMFLPQLQHLPKFLDFSPDDDQFTCIFPLARAQFRQCLNPVNKKDRRSAHALRDEICALDPFEDGIEAYLQSYAQLCCCTRYHRAQVGDPPLLKQLCRQWEKQLRAAHILDGQEAIRPAAAGAVQVEAVKDAEADKLEILLHQDATTPKNVRRDPQDSTPESYYELQVVKKRLSAGPQDHHKSAPADASDEDDCQTLNTKPEKIVRRSTNSNSQVHPHQPQPTHPARTSLRTIQTRSQTGSLPWSFTPRRCPAERTMLKTLTDPISEYSSQVGVIYLYTRWSDPGYIKLGCTTRDPHVRMKEWEKSCGYKPDLLYTSELVPNVLRLESLLKKDLSLQGRGRQETYCKHNKHCPKNHTEWFEISFADAVLLVDTWIAWMREESPYRCIAKAAGKNPPVALIREEWRQYFDWLSQRRLEIRSQCLLVHLRSRKVSVNRGKLIETHESADEEAYPEEYVSTEEALQKSVPQPCSNTPKKGDSRRSYRRDRDDGVDKALERVGGSQQVANDLLNRDVAVVVALASTALCTAVRAQGFATSSTFDASSQGDMVVGAGVHKSRSSNLAKTPLRQIMAC